MKVLKLPLVEPFGDSNSWLQTLSPTLFHPATRLKVAKKVGT